MGGSGVLAGRLSACEIISAETRSPQRCVRNSDAYYSISAPLRSAPLRLCGEFSTCSKAEAVQDDAAIEGRTGRLLSGYPS